MSDGTIRPGKMSPTSQQGPYSAPGMSAPYGPVMASPEATEAAKATYAPQTSPQKSHYPDRTSSSAAAAAATMAMSAGPMSPTGGRPGYPGQGGGGGGGGGGGKPDNGGRFV